MCLNEWWVFCLEAKEKRQCAGAKGGVVSTYEDVIIEIMYISIVSK